MWTDVLALHRQGRIRVTELRSSDYFGLGATKMTSVLGEVVIDRVAAGRLAVMPVGRTDVLHSWTYLPDVGDFAAQVAIAGEAEAGGRVRVGWMPLRASGVAPGTCPPRRPGPSPLWLTKWPASPTAAAVGVVALPRPIGTALGAVVPLLREMRETRHQFERPFVLDSSQAEQVFSMSATPREEALAATIADRRGSTSRAGDGGGISATAGGSGW